MQYGTMLQRVDGTLGKVVPGSVKRNVGKGLGMGLESVKSAGQEMFNLGTDIVRRGSGCVLRMPAPLAFEVVAKRMSKYYRVSKWPAGLPFHMPTHRLSCPRRDQKPVGMSLQGPSPASSCLFSLWPTRMQPESTPTARMQLCRGNRTCEAYNSTMRCQTHPSMEGVLHCMSAIGVQFP